MATLITVVILQIPDLQLLDVADLLDWFFMVLPNYSLGMAFNNLYTNARAVEYCTRPLVALACSAGIRPNPCCKETRNCGPSGCIEYNENALGWEGLGIGRMITFLAIDGFVFISILLLIELHVWDKVKYLLTSGALQNSPAVDSETGGKTVEDNDVARERELIHSKPVAVLQLENNLVIK